MREKIRLWIEDFWMHDAFVMNESDSANENEKKKIALDSRFYIDIF